LNGIAFLYKWEKKRDVLSSLIVTIGTGTSIILKDKTFEHIGGTAMGGGMFMALMKLLYKMDDYQAIIELASKGNRYNVDLKVSDIYPIDDNRIDDLFREYTAASLGKISNRQNVELLNKEDVIQSILCIIGENIGMISSQLADIYSIQEIIFCGGLLIDNKILKNMLSMMSKLRNKKAIFLKNSEFAGAIGALLT
jgi:type II pantothenate kinase